MKRRTEAERRKLVEECRQSGKPKSVWCREKGIPLTTFANWSKAVSREVSVAKTPAKSEHTVQWAEFAPMPEISAEGTKQPATEPASIRLFGGGYEIRVETGFDPELLAGVLQVVSRICY